MSRAESAAATRVALLRAASSLLDSGGVDAVTLRAVGEQAGVSRTAAYRHFVDKNAMLAALSEQGWEDLSSQMSRSVADPERTATTKLRAVTDALVGFARQRPNLYRLMLDHVTPAGRDNEPSASTLAHSTIFDLVAEIVPAERAPLFAGLLIVTTHGISDLREYLDGTKPGTDSTQLLDLIVNLISQNAVM